MQLDTHSRPPLRIPKPPMTPTAIREWWNAASGYRAVLQLAWPLILSNSSSTILQFIDRIFLTWYSPEAMAASMSSGAMAFTIQSFFLGISGYIATFVAQYTGNQRPDRAVRAVWQAIYFSIAASLLVMLFIPLAGPIFRLAGHTAGLRTQEIIFYRIFLLATIFFLLGSSISGYYIGRGQTRMVLYTSLLSVLTNLVLDWLLIFGNYGMPRMGIAGAALASVIAAAVATTVLFSLFLRETWHFHQSGFDRKLFTRFLRFGFPNGLQVTLDMGIWSFFLLWLGGLGSTELAASSITFQINTVAFWPMFGFGMAASTLVGQRLGEDRPDLAARATWSAYHMTLVYSLIAVLIFVFAPQIFIIPFQAHADPATFAPVAKLAVTLLRFVSIYVLFDAANIVFASALKGAGDVYYVMGLSSGLGVLLLVLPTMLFCGKNGLGLYGAWVFLTFFVCVLAIAFLWRFQRGHWRDMRVIEREVIVD